MKAFFQNATALIALSFCFIALAFWMSGQKQDIQRARRIGIGALVSLSISILIWFF